MRENGPTNVWVDITLVLEYIAVRFMITVRIYFQLILYVFSNSLIVRYNSILDYDWASKKELISYFEES